MCEARDSRTATKAGIAVLQEKSKINFLNGAFGEVKDCCAECLVNVRLGFATCVTKLSEFLCISGSCAVTRFLLCVAQ